jgi:UDP-xylose:glucoside alpha-1,3-xylosyltransferase
MNLTRLRHFNFEQLSFEYYVKYKSQIRIGDQDILNAMFHFQPEKLYVLPCNYNYRSCHWYLKANRILKMKNQISFSLLYFSPSKTNNTCKEAEDKGVYILHTNGMQSHKSTFDYEPAFNALYETIKNVSVQYKYIDFHVIFNWLTAKLNF